MLLWVAICAPGLLYAQEQDSTASSSDTTKAAQIIQDIKESKHW